MKDVQLEEEFGLHNHVQFKHVSHWWTLGRCRGDYCHIPRRIV